MLTIRTSALQSVKHLNPRQGITSEFYEKYQEEQRQQSVKHLNPRQGITSVLLRATQLRLLLLFV